MEAYFKLLPLALVLNHFITKTSYTVTIDQEGIPITISSDCASLVPINIQPQKQHWPLSTATSIIGHHEKDPQKLTTNPGKVQMREVHHSKSLSIIL